MFRTAKIAIEIYDYNIEDFDGSSGGQNERNDLKFDV